MRDRVGQVAPHELVDALVKGGGEQQPLRIGGRGVQDALDDGQEAEIRHVVGLVEHGDLDRAEDRVAGAEVVEQSARAGDDQVEAGAQRGDLRAGGHSAEDDGRSQSQRVGQRLGGLVDLYRQLPGRCEDHGARPVRQPLARRRGEPGEDRQQEGQGLSGAGAAAAEHVAPGQ